MGQGVNRLDAIFGIVPWDEELQPDIRSLIKIAPPHCIKFFKVGLLFRVQLINEHNAFIRVDCQIEIGGPESAIFCYIS